MKLRVINILLLLCIFATLRAQSPLDALAMRAIMVNQLFPQERVYLHFDNTAYYLGETMWFKAYVTEGVKDAPTTLSKVLYVELVAPEGYVVETKKYKIDEKGTCNGEFELKPLLLSGYYEIRAYTRYMLNWGKEAVFSRVFPIFDKVNGNNWDFKNMLDRRRGFMYRGEWVSSELPELDLKFYPEGGHLINGIETTVAYELRGEDGIAGEDTVYIYAGKNLLQRSVPTHAGKGIFKILPEAGAKYHATVKRGKKEHKFEFPKIEKEGVAISVTDEQQKVSIKVSNNLESSTAIGCAVLHRGELSHYQKYYSDNNGKIITIDKDSLREGVNRVIVFVDDSLPLAERQFFVMHENIQPGDRETAKLKVTANGEPLHKLSLKPHEKFSVTIEREDGKPIEENTELSLSVSDAAGRQQTSYTHNMYSYLLLGSELKGYIPDAARYFDVANKNRTKELDLLMLTNGWTSYDWSKLAKKDIKLDQPLEKGITVKGTFYKKERSNKMGSLGDFTLIPQNNLAIKFEISYKDSIVNDYEFSTNGNGSFQLQIDDFHGKKVGALTPIFATDQTPGSLYSFVLDRYYSPEFRLYDYWEQHLGKPLNEKREERIKSVKLRPFEYMLTSVEVTATKKRERFDRPPHSEMRFDYLDEWEYAQDVTYLRVSQNYDKQNEDIIESQKERLKEIVDENRYKKLVDLHIGQTGIYSIPGKFDKSTPPYIKYLGNVRYWSPQKLQGIICDCEAKDPNDFVVPRQMYPDAYTAADVVRSAIKRHNYNWAYWVQLMVVANEYDSDSIPKADYKYLNDKNPKKMTNFKEIVIRSDKGAREQFENLQTWWTQRGSALDNKSNYIKFYLGFLSQMFISGTDGADGYSGDNFYRQLENGMHLGSSYPLNPNYVACMIPYEEGDEKRGIVPELYTGSVKRYTSIQGYNNSKQFYSPDYGGKQPSEKDFRRTLIWVPSVKITGGKVTVELCNSSVAKEINVNAEGYNNGTIFGSDLNILTRTLTDEQRAIAEQKSMSKLKNNPTMLAHCLKLINDGQKLYKEQEYTTAFDNFKKAAGMGEPTAIYLTGICYSYGQGTEKDSVKAFNLYRSAANCGIPAAIHQLATCYKDGSGTEKNDALALKWYTVAADSGLVRSMSMLAKSYDEGLFTEKNSEKAIEWYKRAAQKEEPFAMYKVARLYEHNDSVEGKKGKILRESETIKLYTHAAELNNVQAQMKLAEFYGNGRYVKKDKNLRCEWLLHAANNSNIEAQELVGECYEKGRGTQKNALKAYNWYKKAAAQGSELGKLKAKEYELFKSYK